MKCYLCPNKCGVDREFYDGKCHADNVMRICRISPHYDEEPIISGTRGSGAVFFSGCSMDCSFCQNSDISKKKAGKAYAPYKLAEELKNLERQGVHNINFVTPTHFSDKIIETLNIYRPSVPIVYNTSGYELSEIIKKLENYVDIYLTDVKYSDNISAVKYSGRKDYVDYCIAATDEMVASKSLVYDENGLLKQGVIIRHLVIPGELQNTFGVIKLFADRWKGRAIFSLMSQFFPAYKSPIQRTLKPIEYKLALKKVEECGIEDCFIQELSSAKPSYVPKFEV